MKTITAGGLAMVCLGLSGTLSAELSRSALSLEEVCPRAETMHPVPFDVGAAEFAEGDALSVERVDGCGSGLEGGGHFVVVGRYRLGSKDRATLLVGSTATGTTTSPHEPATVRVRRGQGSFRLPLHLFDGGKPHVTLYDVRTGRPFSGVYFGRGGSLLEEKSWRYAEGEGRVVSRPQED